MWRSWDRASWYISIVKPTRCTIFEFIEYHSTCFLRSFRPSSGVQDCTYSVKYMSYRFIDCLLAGTRSYPLYVQSWTPDDGRKDRPKHVEWYSINSKNCESFWFYYRNTGAGLFLQYFFVLLCARNFTFQIGGKIRTCMVNVVPWSYGFDYEAWKEDTMWVEGDEDVEGKIA